MGVNCIGSRLIALSYIIWNNEKRKNTILERSVVIKSAGLNLFYEISFQILGSDVFILQGTVG